jgi:hypothetical protein
MRFLSPPYKKVKKRHLKEMGEVLVKGGGNVFV